MARFKTIVVLFALTVTCSCWGHPLKLSFAKLWMAPNGELQIKIKLFEDDLGSHMKTQYRLDKPDFSATTKNGTKTLQRYFLENLYVIQDGKKIDFIIKKVRLTKGKTALEFTAQSTNRVNINNAFTLRNSVMTDAFQNQVNKVMFKEETYNFNLRKKEYIFNE